jgi:Na+-translocating ferredoxin:NAD+ oxidoreductase RNF subunit RnfB
MTVISYTLEKCQKCMACIRVCPTEAIFMQNQRIEIQKDKCINCGDCLRACEHQGLQAKGSTLEDINQYEKTIALISPAAFGECESKEDIESLLSTIQGFGFDEVVELSAYEGLLFNFIRDNCLDKNEGYVISSFCPVINRLIALKYPVLLESLIPIDYAAEIAAKHLKEQNEGIQLGVFLLCECVSKLALGVYPYGNPHTSIDHSISLVDLFPRIVKNRVQQGEKVSLCAEGLKNIIYDIDTQEGYQGHTLVADGLKRAMLALDLAEFNRLKGDPYLWLSNCLHGCVGGNLLWGNPFEATIAYRKHIETADKPTLNIDLTEWVNQPVTFNRKVIKSLKQRLSDYEKIQAISERLPGYDCGACGYPSCRVLAEEISVNKAKIDDCVILTSREDAG